MDDQQIVALYLERNERAVEHTKVKYGNRLRRLAREIVGDDQTAEECENDTYVKAWESIPPHEPFDYLYAFLVRIDRNIALNICRSRNTRKRSAQIEELTAELAQVLPGSDTVEETMDEQLLREILNDFLAGLDPERRNIFVRRYWYLDSVAEIASGYGISESKVKMDLYRCRSKLKTVLEQEGYPV